MPRVAAVSFAEALKDKGLRCGELYFELHTKSIFVERLPLNVQDSMRMYLAARPTLHFRQLEQ